MRTTGNAVSAASLGFGIGTGVGKGLTCGLALALALLGTTASAGENDVADDDKLLAFIGQKMRLEAQPPTPPEPPRCRDCVVVTIGNAHFVASYRILETVYGNYRGGTISFDVYDHYGVPSFSRYDTVLLFVRRQPDGSWLHEKYQAYGLYKGVDGEWYGCGDPYQGAPHPGGSVHARPVQFAAPVSYPLDGLSGERIESSYPAGYFEIRDGRAYCLMGAPVAELVRAKRETVLKARRVGGQDR
jgi:hypothetical protein